MMRMKTRDNGMYYTGLFFEVEKEQIESSSIKHICHFTVWGQRCQLQ